MSCRESPTNRNACVSVQTKKRFWTKSNCHSGSKLALRQLQKVPGFAMLTLALGIGANTAIFTLVHAVLMKSLPVADPATLYRIGDRDSCCVNGGFPNDDGDFDLFSYELFVTCNNRRWNFRSSQTFSQDTAGLIPDEHQARRRTQRRKPGLHRQIATLAMKGWHSFPNGPHIQGSSTGRKPPSTPPISH